MGKCRRSLNRLGSRFFLGITLSVSIPNFLSVPFLPTTRMDRKRERYNSRARQSTAGGASHKKRKRKSANGPIGGGAAETPVAVISDPNAEIINLKPLEQKELEKRERVRQQVRTLFPLRRCPSRLPSLPVTCQMTIDADTSHSRKKKKKLEKYIVCEVPESSHLSLTSVSGKEIETGGAS